jgi:hypothetical protein
MKHLLSACDVFLDLAISKVIGKMATFGWQDLDKRDRPRLGSDSCKSEGNE